MDMSLICRLCLKVPPVPVSIFEDNVSFLIEDISSLKVTKSDGLPSNVCESCINELKLASKVKKRILKSNKILISKLNASKDKNSSRKALKKSPGSISERKRSERLKHKIIKYSSGSDSEDLDLDAPLRTSQQPSGDCLGAEPVPEEAGTLEAVNEAEEAGLLKEVGAIKREDDFKTEDIYNDEGDFDDMTPFDDKAPEVKNEPESLDEQIEQISKLFDPKFFKNIKWEDEFTLLIKDDEIIEKIYKNDAVTYFCKICDKSIDMTRYRRADISLHKNKHKQAICKTCGIITRYDNMKKHVVCVHKSGPQICHVCGTTHKNVEGLRSHLFYYHRERQLYKCDICNGEFRTSGRLVIHKRQHTGEKPYQCDYCEKSFICSSTLKKHVNLVHLKKRDYPCKFCKKNFSSRYALKTHQRQHTGELPYTCSYCSEGYRQFVSLRTHLKSKHGILVETNRPGYTYAQQNKTLSEVVEDSIGKVQSMELQE